MSCVWRWNPRGTRSLIATITPSVGTAVSYSSPWFRCLSHGRRMIIGTHPFPALGGWFVLHHNVLTYYRNPADDEPAGQVELSGGRLETESSAKHDYHLTIHPEHRKAFEVRVPSGSDDAAGTYSVFVGALRRTALTSSSAEHWDDL